MVDTLLHSHAQGSCRFCRLFNDAPDRFAFEKHQAVQLLGRRWAFSFRAHRASIRSKAAPDIDVGHHKKFIVSLSAHQMKTKVISLSSLIIIFAGCAQTPYQLSKENVDRENKICEAQVKADQAILRQGWFTRWIECKRGRVMPFEIMQYPTKEKEIRAMYLRLIEQGKGVDTGVTAIQAVYSDWDQMQIQIGMKQCLTRIVDSDGSSRCMR